MNIDLQALSAMWTGKPTARNLIAIAGRADGLVKWSLLDAVQHFKKGL